MGLIVLLIIAALVVGAVGLLIEGLLWLLVIAGVLLVAGFVAGAVQRGARTANR